MDAMTLRLLGRNRVIDDLLRAGLQSALPLVDGTGVDLFAFGVPRAAHEPWISAPVRVRASSGRAFAIDEGAERIPGLLHAFVWGLGGSDERVYVLDHREARTIAEQMGFALPQTGQFALYDHQAPSRSLMELIEPYRTGSDRWRDRLSEVVMDSMLESSVPGSTQLSVQRFRS